MTIRDAAGSLHGTDGKYTLDAKAKGNTAALGADAADDAWHQPFSLDDRETTESAVVDEDDNETKVEYRRDGDVLTAVACTSPLPPLDFDYEPGSDIQAFRSGYGDAVGAYLDRHDIHIHDAQQLIESWGAEDVVEIVSRMPIDTPQSEVQERVLQSIRDGLITVESLADRVAIWDTYSKAAENLMGEEFHHRAWSMAYDDEEDLHLGGEEIDPSSFTFDSETRQRIGQAVSDNLEQHDATLHDIVAQQQQQGNVVTIDDARECLADATVLWLDTTEQWRLDIDNLARDGYHKVLRDQSPHPYLHKDGTGGITWE